MNISFQTFVLIFAVTLVHVALLAVWSPLRDEGDSFLSGIDVNALFEEPLPPHSAVPKQVVPEQTEEIEEGGASDNGGKDNLRSSVRHTEPSGVATKGTKALTESENSRTAQSGDLSREEAVADIRLLSGQSDRAKPAAEPRPGSKGVDDERGSEQPATTRTRVSAPNGERPAESRLSTEDRGPRAVRPIEG